MTPSGALARTPLALVPRGPHEAPLDVAGVYAAGAVAAALVDALRAMDDASLRLLRGVRTLSAGPGGTNEANEGADAATVFVVVTGPAALLPWRDGVRYLGIAAPGLYVPTTRATSLPAALAAEALARHLPAAWCETRQGAARLVPLRAGLPLSRAAIERGMAESAAEGA